MTEPKRPPLDRAMTDDEFARWYWEKAELIAFARALGLSTSGRKPELSDRIAAYLSGAPSLEPLSVRRASAKLSEPLSRATVLPPGQSSSQQLRAFFNDVIGPSFTYDVHMRTYLASPVVKTLGDAVDHWYASRRLSKPQTPASLEYVRFTKAWYSSHVNGSARDCRAAWAIFRSLPVDQRPLPKEM